MSGKRSVLFRLYMLSMLLCSATAGLNAQKLNVDSLLQRIEKASNDQERIEEMLVLANYEIRHLKKDSIGMERLLQAKSMAEKSGYQQGILQGQFMLANYHRSRSNWSESIERFNDLITKAGALENDSLKNRFRMMAYNNLGGIYNINGDFAGSLENRLKAMELVEETQPDNYNNKALIYLNVASDYRQLQIPAKALEYLNKTRLFFDSINDRLKMEFYYEYFQNFIAVDSTAGARKMLDNMAAGIAQYDWTDFQKKDYSLMYNKLSAEYYMEMEQSYAMAVIYATDAVALAKELKVMNELADGYYRTGHVYYLQQNMNAAIQQLHIAYDTAAAYNLRNIMRKATSLLAEAYAKTGNFARAYQYERETLQISNLIYDQDKTKEINFLESKYQHQKKEKEIAALQLANISKELALSKRKRQLWIGAGAGAALLIMLTLFYLNARQRRQIAEKDRMLQLRQINYLEGQQKVISLQAMVDGQETERTRIAKDLHDGLGGLFSTIKMYFSTLQHEKPELSDNAMFAKSYELVHTAAEEVRRVAHNMMPEVLIKMGLIQAVQEYCNSMNASGRISIRLQHYGMNKRLEASVEIMLYRIIQELLHNIIKHAEATEAILQFNKIEDRLTVTVEDNGKGFDSVADDGRTHAGITSVQSRVDYLQGKMNIESEQGIGTTVMMEFSVQ